MYRASSTDQLRGFVRLALILLVPLLLGARQGDCDGRGIQWQSGGDPSDAEWVVFDHYRTETKTASEYSGLPIVDQFQWFGDDHSRLVQLTWDPAVDELGWGGTEYDRYWYPSPQTVGGYEFNLVSPPYGCPSDSSACSKAVRNVDVGLCSLTIPWEYAGFPLSLSHGDFGFGSPRSGLAEQVDDTLRDEVYASRGSQGYGVYLYVSYGEQDYQPFDIKYHVNSESDEVCFHSEIDIKPISLPGLYVLFQSYCSKYHEMPMTICGEFGASNGSISFDTTSVSVSTDDAGFLCNGALELVARETEDKIRDEFVVSGRNQLERELDNQLALDGFAMPNGPLNPSTVSLAKTLLGRDSLPVLRTEVHPAGLDIIFAEDSSDPFWGVAGFGGLLDDLCGEPDTIPSGHVTRNIRRSQAYSYDRERPSYYVSGGGGF